MRISRDNVDLIGPGKIDVLEAIEQTGSISEAARSLGMSYRRAWVLIDDLNKALQEPAVTAAIGGTGGGGTVLTPEGKSLLQHYRAIETSAMAATISDVKAMAHLLAP